MTPHPQRCETCKSKSCWFSPIYDTKINRLPSNISKWDEYVVVKNFTSVYGCASHSSAPAGQEIRDKVLQNIPDVLICQSLPNEHGFCGTNDCFCKGLQRVESGDICKWMQENRKAELRTPTPEAQR